MTSNLFELHFPLLRKDNSNLFKYNQKEIVIIVNSINSMKIMNFKLLIGK